MDSTSSSLFGKKIYFDDAASSKTAAFGDVGGGGGGDRGEASSAPAPPAAPPQKKGKGVAQGTAQQQPPRCQVEGCNVDLSGAKAYYSRHKVCGMHSKSPKVVVGGLEQRFCQQCSRFHQLPEFDQGKRSCRRRLAGHNERRRKPPPGPLSPRFGRLSPSFQDSSSRFGGFVMDFSYPRVQGVPRDVWPTVRPGDRIMSNQWHQGGMNAPISGITSPGAHQYMQGPSSGAFYSAPGIPPGQCVPGVSSDSSCALSLLSNQQPWSSSSSTARNEALSISTSSTFSGTPMAQSVSPSSYSSSPWGFKDHGSGSSSHGSQHVGIGQVDQPDAERDQFSGELELALQGNRMELDPSRAYDHSDDVIHWSL